LAGGLFRHPRLEITHGRVYGDSAPWLLRAFGFSAYREVRVVLPARRGTKIRHGLDGLLQSLREIGRCRDGANHPAIGMIRANAGRMIGDDLQINGLPRSDVK
jgi:hypothetical protein